MNLSKETLAIFKNFANINANLTIKPGSKISTISPGKNIIAEATLEESFDDEFGIYDMNEFLGVMTLFEQPELEFKGKAVVLSEDKRKVKYYAAAANLLSVVPTMRAFPVADIEFDLPGTVLAQIQRASSILHVGDFSIVGNGATIEARVGDKTNSTSNTFHTELGLTDLEFVVNFKVENLMLMAGDYHVEIGGKSISKFTALNRPLLYYVALEKDSTFNF